MTSCPGVITLGRYDGATVWNANVILTRHRLLHSRSLARSPTPLSVISTLLSAHPISTKFGARQNPRTTFALSLGQIRAGAGSVTSAFIGRWAINSRFMRSLRMLGLLGPWALDLDPNPGFVFVTRCWPFATPGRTRVCCGTLDAGDTGGDAFIHGIASSRGARHYGTGLDHGLLSVHSFHYRS